ncbi:MAG: ABC transporter permease [Bacillota bacterium]
MTLDVLVSFAEATVRLSVPIILAAIGILFMSKSGVLNIGMEGMVLIGALVGVVGADIFSSSIMGMLTAIVIGGAIGLIFAFLVVTTGADQVVIGTAFNLLGLGVTTVFGRKLLGMGTEAVMVDKIPDLEIDFLQQIPVIGSIIFSQNVLIYFAFIMIPVTAFLFTKTNWGLKVRSVGEKPLAAETVGIKVHRIRYSCCVIGGMFSGLAGCSLTLGILNQFTENVVAGRGFIALSAVIFGRWTPTGTMGGALLFGGADALQLRLQSFGIGIPYQFMLMFPYLLTMITLAWFSRKTSQPGDTGIPYKSLANRS